jgi:DnaJ-class molecular chaperone
VKNYYQILGINPNATADEIKQAYRRLASRHHPDKGGDTAQFQEIQKAYEVLSDPAQRSNYDNPKPKFGGFSGNPGNFDFDAIFDMFGADLKGSRQQSPRVSLWIGLSDVMTGGPRTISLQVSNKIINIEINIPPGIGDGDSIRYPGLVNGGDLIVIYRVKPDAIWHRDGNNLIREHVVDVWDLILGGELTIQNCLGKEFVVRIPEDTQPGSVLRARGQGLPPRQLTGDRPTINAGDLLIRLQAKISTPVSDGIKDAIRKSRGQ